MINYSSSDVTLKLPGTVFLFLGMTLVACGKPLLLSFKKLSQSTTSQMMTLPTTLNFKPGSKICTRMAFLLERATSITSIQGAWQRVNSLLMCLRAWYSRVRASMPPWTLDWWTWQASFPTLHQWCASRHQPRKMKRLWSPSWTRFLISLSLLTRLLWCMCCHNLPRMRWERSTVGIYVYFQVYHFEKCILYQF